MSLVLVVDDEEPLRRALELNLTARGHEVMTAADGGSALLTAGRRPPDLVILDVGLPDIDGMDVIAGLRGWSSVPIIVLTARTGTGDTIAALEAGADDYVTKPFVVGELLARITAQLRRGAPVAGQAVVTLGPTTVDVVARSVLRDGQAIHLSPTEWRMLELLLHHPGHLVSQGEILRAVWGPAYSSETQYLRRFMNKLRVKLEVEPDKPRHLITEPGMGYRYQP